MTPAAVLSALLAFVLQGTLILAAGFLLLASLRARDPFFRLPCLEGLFWSALVLPVLLALLPNFRSAPPPPVGRGITLAFAAAAPLAKAPPDSAALALSLVALLSLLLAARLGLGLVNLQRLSAKAVPLAPLPEALKRAAAAAGVTARFARSDRLSSPVTFGWIRPVVLLPPHALLLDERALFTVVLHELTHVRRRHFLKGLLEELAASLLWFHPILRLALREIRLTREQAVDLSVIRRTGEQRLYLHTLAAMARVRRGAAPVLLQPFLHRGHLVKRLALLTQEVTMTKKKCWAGGIAAAAAVLLTGAFAANRLPMDLPNPGTPAPPADSQAPLPSMEGVYEMGGLPQPKLLDGPAPVFPPEAREKGVTGRVILEIVILESGEVSPEHRVLSAADPALARAAWEAVSRWKYEPTLVEGKPVRRKQIVYINFSLN